MATSPTDMGEQTPAQRARIRTTVWILSACALAAFVGFFVMMTSQP